MEFDKLTDLFSYIEQKAQEVMKNEVADAVTENLSKAVEHTVYETYEPKYYHRRLGNDGLSDTNNMTVTEVPDGIIITNDTPLDNGRLSPRLDEIIVYGEGRQPFARDFYASAQESLEQSDTIENAMKTGLRNRGIDTK